MLEPKITGQTSKVRKSSFLIVPPAHITPWFPPFPPKSRDLTYLDLGRRKNCKNRQKLARIAKIPKNRQFHMLSPQIPRFRRQFAHFVPFWPIWVPICPQIFQKPYLSNGWIFYWNDWTFGISVIELTKADCFGFEIRTKVGRGYSYLTCAKSSGSHISATALNWTVKIAFLESAWSNCPVPKFSARNSQKKLHPEMPI